MLGLVTVSAFALWVVFLGGAERLEGSWLTGLLHVPGMTAAEIRVWAVLSVLVALVVSFFLDV